MTIDILLIDDDSLDREAIHRLLPAEQYRIHDAALFKDGLELSKANTIACVLLDHHLPDCEGVERLPELTALDLPVIMLTGQGSERIAVEAMKAGAFDYLMKEGLEKERLIKAIDQAIEKKLLQRTVEEQRQELSKRAEELERSNNELQQFAYSASHDLQEPLRSIGGFAGLLNDGYAERLDERGIEYLDIITSSAKRLQSMIEDLLAFSRAQSREYTPEPNDLNKTIAHVRVHLHQRLQDSGGKILAEDLPIVSADRVHLLKVLQHLVDNGLKFNTSETPQVTVTANKVVDKWEICVADNGIGIEDRFHGCVFDVFRRLHTRREYEGNGIGLSICKRILERLDSDLRLESKLGEGSKFCFELPVAAKAEAKPTG